MTHIDAAKAWLAQDPDPVTRDELAPLIEGAESGAATALAALRDRFGSRLAFGTAGLRGELGAGSNRMNRVLVAQAAAGFARFLVARAGASGATGADAAPRPSVVIGFDGRTNSEIFARDSAELMAGAGVRAILLPRMLPTPVLAFAVRHLGVSAGIMVTASHNPPRDNGYKVYLGDEDGGSQIVSPADGEIHEAILAVAHTLSVQELPRSTDYEVAGDDVVDAYVAATAAVAARSGEPRIPVPFVYTAMHGVGWQTTQRVLEAAGLGEPTVVPEQVEPDTDFPTTPFPNPEEPGALDLAIACASSCGAGLIIAHDPDADRLAVAVPTPEPHELATPDSAGWRRLSGNEVGALLGWRAAERLARDGQEGALAASLVSSPALATIARHYGLDYRDTLTGFKWISRTPRLQYGFEEALGYLVNPETVRDKDGISAMVEFLTLMGELAAAGRTLAEHQADFDERFGAFASAQVSLRVTDVSRIGQIMTALREQAPAEIGGVRVSEVDDFSRGFGDYPPGDILRFWMHGGARVIVRPSGTEPKVKVYIDASSDSGSAAERRADARAEVAALEAGMRELIA